MVADDALVASWIKNLDIFASEERELVTALYRFPTVGYKKIALIIPKDGELGLISVLPGDRVMTFESAAGKVDVNPNLITEAQEIKLMRTGRVRRVQLQFSPKDLQELAKTDKAND